MSLTISRSSVKRAASEFVTQSGFTDQIIIDFFESLDTPKSLAACLLFKYDEHVQLLDLDLNPSDYLETSADLFHRDYMAVSFLSKFDSLNTGYDKEARGLAKFFLMEKQCKLTNHRFRSYSAIENSEYAPWLFVMKRKIDMILGDFDVEEFFDKSSWGPGSTTSLKGCDVSATRKFQSEIDITRDAYTLLGSSLGSAYPGWFREEHVSDSSIHLVKGNAIVSVPKNSKINRVIAIEPGLNLYFQKGIGSMIKRRLKRRGVDLTNQGINQSKSMLGSLNGDLATVDFSSASDSIARNLVKFLLPEKWHLIMDSLRSKFGTFKDTESIFWEKFSSMGNGFTFELESLIFYAAALTTCEFNHVENFDVSVYGDDVIIPSAVFESYSKFCDFLGFTVNTEKSFCSGYFRESCGAHYYRGFDVKPIFLKERLSDAFSFYKLANSIRRLAHRRNFNYGCDVRLLSTWRHILKGLPHCLRTVKIPEGYGDGGILSSFDEACPPTAGLGFEGFLPLSLSRKGIQNAVDCIGLLQERLTQITGSLSSLRLASRSHILNGTSGLSDLGYGNNTTLRDLTSIRCKAILVPSWYDIGFWV